MLRIRDPPEISAAFVEFSQIFLDNHKSNQLWKKKMEFSEKVPDYQHNMPSGGREGHLPAVVLSRVNYGKINRTSQDKNITHTKCLTNGWRYRTLHSMA